jgi:hypothetical protein
MNKINKIALEFYLDYVNNYLTMEQIAEDYEIGIGFARALHKEGKSIFKAAFELKSLDK